MSIGPAARFFFFFFFFFFFGPEILAEGRQKAQKRARYDALKKNARAVACRGRIRRAPATIRSRVDDRPRHELVRRQEIAEHAMARAVELRDGADQELWIELIGVAQVDDMDVVDLCRPCLAFEVHEVVREVVVQLALGCKPDARAGSTVRARTGRPRRRLPGPLLNEPAVQPAVELRAAVGVARARP